MYFPCNSSHLTLVEQGYTELRYDEERKRVVYEPLQLTQAFRYVFVLTSVFP